MAIFASCSCRCPRLPAENSDSFLFVPGLTVPSEISLTSISISVFPGFVGNDFDVLAPFPLDVLASFFSGRACVHPERTIPSGSFSSSNSSLWDRSTRHMLSSTSNIRAHQPTTSYIKRKTKYPSSI
uniref:Uncharacterized protein n=1 Tax=Salix viminalis TaxID=40686 RepID=A0A6N2MCT8_SALVM